MTEPKLFTIIRHADASGVSGLERVLDGVIFHTGQVVVCWRSDVNQPESAYSSIGIYPSWDAFKRIHIDSHPENYAEVVFITN